MKKDRGITGDITERLATFASAGASAQRAADKVIHDQIESKIEAIAATEHTLDQADKDTIINGLASLTVVAMRDRNAPLLNSIQRTLVKFGVTLDAAEELLKISLKKKGRNR